MTAASGPDGGVVETTWGPCRRPLLILGVHLLVFAVARVLLLVVHRADFESLAAGEVAFAFVRGAWFDLSIIMRLLGLPLLFMMLPFAWAHRAWWQRVVGWYAFVVLLLFGALHAVDLVYFGYVHRHLGLELGYMTAEDARTYALGNHLSTTLIALGAAGVLAFGWNRVLRPPSAPSGRKAVGLAACLAFLLVGGLAARGGIFLRKTMHVGDAYDDVSLSCGRLVLSGPFAALTTYASILKREEFIADVEFYDPDEALVTVRDLAIGPGEQVVDPAYPLLRVGPDRPVVGQPNLVVILLEGWDAAAVDACRRARGEEPLGLTPRFDALAAEGILFTNFYSTGQRSLEGIYSISTGNATLPGMPYLGAGLEQVNMPFAAGLARQEGYGTHFVQASGRYFQRVHSAVSMAGFENIEDGEVIPRDTELRPRGEGIAWDHETFQEGARVLDGAGQPFFAFIFTAATHEPYNWPDARFDRVGTATERDRYLNSVAYADDSLGAFFDRVRRAPWFDSTVFVIVADHGSGHAYRADDSPRLFRIPCLLIGPGLAPALDDRVGSHIDLLPTLADLGGWRRTAHAALGRSLLEAEPAAGHGSLSVWGNILMRVEADGYVLHNLQDRVEGRALGPGADLDAIERRLLSMIQVAYRFYRSNRFAPLQE